MRVSLTLMIQQGSRKTVQWCDKGAHKLYQLNYANISYLEIIWFLKLSIFGDGIIFGIGKPQGRRHCSLSLVQSLVVAVYANGSYPHALFIKHCYGD